MARTFALTIATPFARLFAGEVVAVRVRAVDGYLGVLAGHAPLVAELAIGEIVVTVAPGQKRYFASAGGVLRVEREGVTILCELAEAAEEIDVPRAQRALERAQQRLSVGARGGGVDVLRAELALARALNRLKVAQHAQPS